MKYVFKMLDNEHWWGGTADHGTRMPFDNKSEYMMDFRLRAPNQTMPLFVSDKGRYIWSDKPFKVEISDGEFILESQYDISLCHQGSTLKDAYLSAMKSHFPFSGQNVKEEFFTSAQFNTWIEFTYHQNQNGIIEYADNIVKEGYKPGIIMIDEGWQRDYGDWTFDKEKFPEAKKMVDHLHSLGFKVMLWVVPMVCPDGKYYREYKDDTGHFLRNEKGEPALVKWWNGVSCILDFTKDKDVKFLSDQLDSLIQDYGIDGFKLDGGTLQMYHKSNIVNGNGILEDTPADILNIAWNDFGKRYPYHEYKDTFKGGGKAVIQRIRDKQHSWDKEGINTLIPNAIALGLIGHPFICPDMIGGGDYLAFLPERFLLDEELFVRMAECSALFPMMQFSKAPWNTLSEENNTYVKNTAKIHDKFKDYILKLVKESEISGEPIIRNMEYEFPDMGYSKINSQFMLGSDMLVAPVTVKGENKKEVVLPPGEWLYCDEKVYQGGKTVTVDAPLGKVIYFKKL